MREDQVITEKCLHSRSGSTISKKQFNKFNVTCKAKNGDYLHDVDTELASHITELNNIGQQSKRVEIKHLRPNSQTFLS